MKKKRKRKPTDPDKWVETPLAKKIREKIADRHVRRSLSGKPLLVR